MTRLLEVDRDLVTGRTHVIRRLGSGVAHVIEDVAPEEFQPFTHFGADGFRLPGPVKASCGARLRDTIVRMVDTTVDCRACVHITDLDEVRPSS